MCPVSQQLKHCGPELGAGGVASIATVADAAAVTVDAAAAVAVVAAGVVVVVAVAVMRMRRKEITQIREVISFQITYSTLATFPFPSS
jgi:hypothetical protein